MKRIMIAGTCGLLISGLAGCDRLSAAWDGFNNPEPAERPSTAPGSTSTPTPGGALVEAGQAVVLQPGTDQGQQVAASVVELTPLTRQVRGTVKLFGTAGGDPAMNGLYTHVAFFDSPAEGWRVFRIGDFLAYRVLSESEGRVDLELDESVLDDASGQISSRKRRVIVSWMYGRHGETPRSVTVTPAR